MNLFLYNLFISCYYASIRVAAFFGNQKAKQWIGGRKNIFQKLIELRANNSELIWFHCSSLGEFEQGRPVMEKLRMQNSSRNIGSRIVLTFFSPSGYEVRKNYSGADFIFYLPLDTMQNARRFIELVNPDAVYFVKYEYWHHYFHSLKEKNIPLYIVSAIFREDQVFFRWYGKFFRNMLKCVTHFFVQDEASLKKINALGFNNAIVAGDTRFDRVSEIVNHQKEIPLIEKFAYRKRVIVAGSTWIEDERLLTYLELSTLNYKLVIAPHEISEQRISEIVKLLGTNTLRYSQATEQNISEADVLIIDSIGMLSSLYKYGWVTYVGGGLSKGIHNILEAAVYGKPVFFGPNFHKAAEAKALIEKGGAFSVNNFNGLKSHLEKFLKDDSAYSSACEVSRKFVAENTGAAEKIIQFTQKII